MNTAGLKWFGSPERNTLHPLCVVFLCLERVCESLVLSPACVCVCSSPCVQRAPPFYITRGRVHGRWVPDRRAQMVQYKITYCSYIMASQAKEISLLDFLAYSWNPPFSMSRRSLVETAPGVASGVACHVAERPCSLRCRRHDGKVPCCRIQLMWQAGSARARRRRLHCVPR